MGYRVTVFEAQAHPGGMLRYGIPTYRLPREVIDKQVEEIEALGVEFRYQTPLTPGFGIEQILRLGYQAIFMGVGASRGRQLQLEGGDADGVINAIDYLFNINRGYRLGIGQKVVVVGGGLVAIDAARTAVRAMLPGLAIAPDEEAAVAAGTMRVALDAAREAARRGALEVIVVSLESDQEMPAMRSEQGREEMEEAREEGVSFMPGWGPRRVRVENGRATGLELVRCVRTYDEAGRFRPQFDENDHTTVATESIILAIGQAPDLSFVTPADGLEVTPAGTLRIDPVTLATSRPGIFAGGDAAFPPGLLITAAAQGKLAARSIDAYLSGKPLGFATDACGHRGVAHGQLRDAAAVRADCPRHPDRAAGRAAAVLPRSSRGSPPSRRAAKPSAACTATSIRFTTAANVSCAIDASISARSIACISSSPRT